MSQQLEALLHRHLSLHARTSPISCSCAAFCIVPAQPATADPAAHSAGNATADDSSGPSASRQGLAQPASQTPPAAAVPGLSSSRLACPDPLMVLAGAGGLLAVFKYPAAAPSGPGAVAGHQQQLVAAGHCSSREPQVLHALQDPGMEASQVSCGESFWAGSMEASQVSCGESFWAGSSLLWYLTNLMSTPWLLF